MQITVENHYSDGHSSTQVVEIDEEPTPAELEDWWDEVAFEHTGDGHYTKVYDATGERLGSCYTVTITAASNPQLIGATNEWID